MPQKRFWTRKKLNAIPIAWLLICAVIPLFANIIGSLVVGISRYSILEIVTYLFDARNGLVAVFNSIFVALISTLLGFYLSFFAIFQRNNLRYILFFIVGFCFVINPIIHYEFFNNLFNKTGVINSLLLHFSLISDPISLNQYWILLVSLVYKFIPISFFLCISALHNTNTNLIEYTLDIGARHPYVIANVIISGVKRQLVLSFCIIALLCFGNISFFITPFLKGDFIASLLLNNLLSTTFDHKIKIQDPLLIDINLSLFVFIWTAGICLLNRYFNKYKSDLYLNPFKRLSKYKCVFIGKDIFTTISSLSVITLYIISVLGLIFYSVKDWNLHLFFDLFKDFNINVGFINQYTLSVLSALIATIFGTMLAISNSKSTDLRKHSFYKHTILSLAVSEVVLLAIARFDSMYMEFYIAHNPFIIVIITMSILGICFSSIYMYSSIRAIDKNIEKASIDLGANYWQTIKSVTLYALYPSIVSCFLLIFICLFNEVTITTMLLYPHPNLSQQILYLSVENSQQMYPLSTLSILFTILILLIANPYDLYNRARLILKSVIMVLLLTTGIFLFIFY